MHRAAENDSDIAPAWDICGGTGAEGGRAYIITLRVPRTYTQGDVLVARRPFLFVYFVFRGKKRAGAFRFSLRYWPR